MLSGVGILPLAVSQASGGAPPLTWLLATGFWSDNDYWLDSATWND